ncbi:MULTISPECIES: MATE family efflux transporter [Bacillus]|uniref:Multidrug export protein MepA n=1 Tax=Bacillus pseudomycoides TaxID=64104 RepID=A0AAJ3R6F2_9BACI|nr:MULTISPECIES: MATE family efflux transporter [Bacillus]MBJ8028688.1 MATE family efflux transporter [Bacillus cereus group sp. N21]MCR8858950.1 MATE family efflux transporter [Bacillus pseudomycoides]MDR4185958.1 MATE family efflux transporter [Bacillus pseudomycoides]MDR4328159.1 MATE family efflux transporter [Bacillus pseudomycoides]MED0854346.1 MATE family efflux transporter [Bacillus pseudomycoides]
MMETTEKLREKPMKNLFISYLIPAVLGMVLMSVNIVIDAVMISRGVGANGLAGVNVAIPAFSIFFSISLWIGMGGATLYSIALGENKIERARSIFTQSMTVAVVIVGALMVICLWRIEDLAYLFGANEVILPYALDYLTVLLTFGMIYVLENILSTFIRNDGNPNLAMAGLVVTALLNIAFDYIFIFIFGWGVTGAAAATILSAAIGFLVLLSHFFRKSSILKWTKFHFEWNTVKQIMVIGFPSFTAEITVAIVTIGFNITFMKYAGELGVASYAIVNSIHSMMLLVFLGVGAALQPIASFHYGANLPERLKEGLNFAVKTAIVLGCVAIVSGLFFGEYIIGLFDVQSKELLTLTVTGMSLFFVQYVFFGYNIVYGEYFQSVRQTRKSILIILNRGLLLIIPLLWIMPKLFGVNGIWLVMPVSEVLTAIVVFGMNRISHPVSVRNIEREHVA